MNAFLTRLAYAFFPRRCLYCDRVIRPDQTSCDDCCDTIPRMDGICCPHCGRTKTDCHCRRHKRAYDRLITAMRYERGAKSAILALKKDRDADRIHTMGQEMAAALRAKSDAAPLDIVTFIPMCKKDERKRGYNQSRLLATEVASLLDLPLKPMLKKCFETHSQKGLPWHERSGNVLGAFDVIAPTKGKRILLVDDLATTGCTLNECAKMLKIYGAESVTALTFAATVPKEKTESNEDENSR
ncbi:MAG: ComF family protein [Clostridia bacterium]|nr:ComF family protein [Clostridia bacterium]